MLPIHSILHPSDFSKRSEYAFHTACSLARDYNVPITILHVLPPPIVVYGNGVIPPEPESYREEIRAKLNRVLPFDPAIRVEHRLTEGDAVNEIVRVAEEAHCDLIVMGTHGWSGLSRLVMGSVAEGVVRRAPCPVLTVKTPFPIAESEAACEAESKTLEPARN